MTRTLSLEDKEAILKKFFEHVEQGFSVESFPDAKKITIDKWLNELNYDEEILEKSKRKGRLVWEIIGKKQSEGTCLGNSRSWYYNMANRYGWQDKISVDADVKGALSVEIVNYSRSKEEKKEDSLKEGE